MMAATAKPQTSIYETVIENTELEQALNERQELKQPLADAQKAYKQADDRARELIARLDLGDDAPVRVGGFVITRRSVQAREVEFTTGASKRLYIKALDE